MSIYRALEFDPPIIAYCALHQARKGVLPADYRKTMQDLHALIGKQSEVINNTWKQYHSETITRVVQMQRSLLTKFLATPLKSDIDEIDGIVREKLHELSERIMPQDAFGVLAASEGHALFDKSAKDLIGRMSSAGKSYLRELGFRTGKNDGEIYESVFGVKGAQNLDIIEHMVRDRIGIYTPVHGKHIQEFDAYAYAAYNLVHLTGELSTRGKYEASLFFSKGDTRYEPFRNGIKKAIEEVLGKRGTSHVSVWQRKLGLGVGREFVLRVRGEDINGPSEFIKGIVESKGGELIRKALVNGHLLVKEMLVS